MSIISAYGDLKQVGWERWGGTWRRCSGNRRSCPVLLDGRVGGENLEQCSSKGLFFGFCATGCIQPGPAVAGRSTSTSGAGHTTHTSFNCRLRKTRVQPTASRRLQTGSQPCSTSGCCSSSCLFALLMGSVPEKTLGRACHGSTQTSPRTPGPARWWLR